MKRVTVQGLFHPRSTAFASDGNMPTSNEHQMIASAVAVGLSKDDCETAPTITTTLDDTTEPHVEENENGEEANCDHRQLKR